MAAMMVSFLVSHDVEGNIFAHYANFFHFESLESLTSLNFNIRVEANEFSNQRRKNLLIWTSKIMETQESCWAKL